jgi:hypothetical protein
MSSMVPVRTTSSILLAGRSMDIGTQATNARRNRGLRPSRPRRKRVPVGFAGLAANRHAVEQHRYDYRFVDQLPELMRARALSI